MVSAKPRVLTTAWALVAAFGTYFCMYAFRKPFTAAEFPGTVFGDMGWKATLVMAQVAGYTISKFIGIRVVSELSGGKRAMVILGLIGASELALFGFPLIPQPWSCVLLFLNGLCLGMVFGLVLGFLEGRRMSEALAAGLCASFILADGVMKSVGKGLLSTGVSQEWMPFVAGLCFLGPLILFVWMLTRIPPPDQADILARSKRDTLTAQERRVLVGRHALGLFFVIFMYLFVTILRSIRADFAPEIWKGLGYEPAASAFSTTEIWVALGVLLVNSIIVCIHDSRVAFFVSLTICFFGFVLLGLSLLGLRTGWIGPFEFMVFLGLGLYFPYVMVHTTVFERLLAVTRDKWSASFLLQLADSYGYLGYIAVMFGKELLVRGESFIEFFTGLLVFVSVLSALLVIGAFIYFYKKQSSTRETINGTVV